MFQFPRLPRPGLCVQPGVAGNDPRRVFPFGDPRVERACAPNRGLSQLVASFVGFLCQGIHRLPLPSSLSDSMESNILSCAPLGGARDAIFFEENLSSRYAALKVRRGRALETGHCAPRGARRDISGTDGASVFSSSLAEVILPRKEVIQPHLPVRLPCYDFTPLTNHTFGASLTRLGRRLRVQSTRVV